MSQVMSQPLFPSRLESDAPGFGGKWLHELADGVEECPYILIMACHGTFQFYQLRCFSLCAVTMCRRRTKARITNTLICTACELFSTFAAMIAPCSVKTWGKNLMFCPRFKITDCDLEWESVFLVGEGMN